MSRKKRLDAPGWASVIGVAVITFSLTGCDSGSSPQAADPPSSLAETAARSPAATPIAADLLQVCDHVQAAFRSGGLNDADQARALSAELQGMIDVARPEAAQVLRPMVEAADAIAADGQARAQAALGQAQNDAFDQLRRVCLRAGSQAWSE